jgi:hypothetical protein
MIGLQGVSNSTWRGRMKEAGTELHEGCFSERNLYYQYQKKGEAVREEVRLPQNRNSHCK